VQQQIAQILTPEQRQFMREHRGQFRPYRARRMNRLRGGRVF
jgi:Spy/CpxP family protein refolding chaperone